MRSIFIFLAMFFMTLPSYCDANLPAKNVKNKNDVIPQRTTTAKETQKAREGMTTTFSNMLFNNGFNEGFNRGLR